MQSLTAYPLMQEHNTKNPGQHLNTHLSNRSKFFGLNLHLFSWTVYPLVGDIVLCSQLRHFTFTVPLTTQVYNWVPTNLMLGGNLEMDKHLIQAKGGVEILLVASCYRNRDKLRPDGPCKKGEGVVQRYKDRISKFSYLEILQGRTNRLFPNFAIAVLYRW